MATIKYITEDFFAKSAIERNILLPLTTYYLLPTTYYYSSACKVQGQSCAGNKLCRRHDSSYLLPP